MPCIIKTRRQEGSRQLAYCGEIIFDVGKHFKTLTEAKKHNVKICQQCIAIINPKPKDRKTPISKKQSKAKTVKKNQQKKLVSKLKTNEVTPIVGDFELNRNEVLNNKELYLSSALNTLRANGQLKATLKGRAGESARIAIAFYLRKKDIHLVAKQYDATVQSIPRRANSGLIKLVNLAKVDPFDIKTWHLQTIWELRKIASLVSLSNFEKIG